MASCPLQPIVSETALMRAFVGVPPSVTVTLVSSTRVSEPSAETPEPPLTTGSTPETCVVSPILPHAGAVARPPEMSALPVATPASLLSVVDALA